MGVTPSKEFSNIKAVHHGLYIIDNSYRMYAAGIIKKEEAAMKINAVLSNIENLKAPEIQQDLLVFGTDSDIVHINVVLDLDGSLYSFIGSWSRHPNGRDSLFSSHLKDSINEAFHDNSDVTQYARVPYIPKKDTIIYCYKE